MEIFKEAGVPDGVINLVYVSGPDAGDVIFKHPDFASFHLDYPTPMKVLKHLERTLQVPFKYVFNMDDVLTYLKEVYHE